MEPIKISVEVSVNLSASTQDFIKSLFVATAAKPVETKPVEAKPVEAKPTTAPAAPVETKPVEAKSVGAKPVEVKSAEPAVLVETKPAASAVSIEDVRQELVKKVNAHREEIKAKLTEFGAPSVTKLDPSKYADMYNFLTSL